jgi:hypothetical protein
MRILVACEYSGTVRDAFILKGHDAISCDILPTELPGPHYQGSVTDILYEENWDMIIAHPPCTYITNSGVRWLFNKEDDTRNEERWASMIEACNFFNLFLEHSCAKVCVENPIPHKHAKELLKCDYTQSIQPYQFGHLEKKRTCFWLKGLPMLLPSSYVIREHMERDLPKSVTDRIHYMSPSPNRQKLRSKFYAGIAQAMAEQWG